MEVIWKNCMHNTKLKTWKTKKFNQIPSIWMCFFFMVCEKNGFTSPEVTMSRLTSHTAQNRPECIWTLTKRILAFQIPLCICHSNSTLHFRVDTMFDSKIKSIAKLLPNICSPYVAVMFAFDFLEHFKWHTKSDIATIFFPLKQFPTFFSDSERSKR